MEKTNQKNQTLTELESVINPFYVFSGTIHPNKYIDLQCQLLERLGPEEYFSTQLNVLHTSISQLISELKIVERSGGMEDCQPNVNIMGNA